MAGEEVKRFKDFSQVSSLDAKGKSDMNNPNSDYRKRSDLVWRTENAILNSRGFERPEERSCSDLTQVVQYRILIPSEKNQG